MTIISVYIADCFLILLKGNITMKNEDNYMEYEETSRNDNDTYYPPNPEQIVFFALAVIFDIFSIIFIMAFFFDVPNLDYLLYGEVGPSYSISNRSADYFLASFIVNSVLMVITYISSVYSIVFISKYIIPFFSRKKK